MVPDNDSYEGAITLIMPGQVKPGTYRIQVKAPDRVTALALIEDEWKMRMNEISVAVSKVKPDAPAAKGDN